MSRLVPNGYLTFREAIGQVETAMFIGVADRPEVARLRKQQGDIGDGEASRGASIELWKAVDRGTVRLMAIGGYPRKIVRLPAAVTRDIPLVRRVGGFAFLRPRNPHYREVTGWFGAQQLGAIALALRERDVKKVCSNLRRRVRRRDASGSKARAGKVGRPALTPRAQSYIKEIAGTWSRPPKIIALASEVSQGLGCAVSEDTVTRALDELYATTLDQRFLRPRRTQNG